MKKLLIFSIITCFGIFVISMGYNYNNYENQVKEYRETNYIGLIKLGLAPSTESRIVLENDIETGIKLTDGRNNYSLVQSRTFKTKDYGKTFLSKIE